MALDTSKPCLQTVSRYELYEKIAEGGMGTVYKARDGATGSIVAVKIVPPQVAKNPILMKRFEQEYAVASTLDHPNIVRALDFGSHGSSWFLVMEFVDGESLGQRIERTGKIPQDEAIRIIAQVAQALHKAHRQGLIHRDVKPDNILVTADGTAKLADLGLVKEVETDLNLTRTGRGLGTPHYMAPEQFRNAKNVDARGDIYSLAATLYNMVTGVMPFQSTGPLDAWMKKINNELVPARELEPSITDRVDWALRRAMSVDREHRPSNCREFIEDLTGHGTRKLTPSAEIMVQDVWYLFYTGDDNVSRTVKGTLQGIRRALKDGVLGDASNIKASRSKNGPYEVLKNHPEFRDLVLTLQEATSAQIPVIPGKPGSSLRPKPAVSPASPRQTPTKPSKTSDVHPKSESATAKVPQSGARRRRLVAPHIQLRTTGERFDSLKWLLLLVAGAGLVALGYYVLPLLVR